MIRIVTIGSGAVAEHLTYQIARNPTLKLVQIFARNAERGRLLAEMASDEANSVMWTANPSELASADLYILAVSDGAVAQLSDSLAFTATAVVAHTAGCVAMEDMNPHIPNRAVIYPLQSFTRGWKIADFRRTPFFIEAATPHSLEVVREVAEALSDNVIEMSSPQRAHIHMAGSWANNFTNLMFTIAEEVALEAGAPFDYVRPIIAETVAKAMSMSSPTSAQTGPAQRGDTSIQAKHIAMLEAAHPEYVELYKLLSKTIWNKTLKKNSPR
jgi:predicted short-subunit dehydrogenase-like oxidoreductase (DUF2520 family)